MGKLLTGRVLEKHQEAWDMFLANYTVAEIAKHFSVSRQSVMRWLRRGAEEYDDPLPREAIMRARFEQVDIKISELEERQSQAGLPHALYIAYSTEIRKWFDFRARLRAEYAPQQIRVETQEPTRYVIEADEITKALS